jgi:hypothetical protein
MAPHRAELVLPLGAGEGQQSGSALISIRSRSEPADEPNNEQNQNNSSEQPVAHFISPLKTKQSISPAFSY